MLQIFEQDAPRDSIDHEVMGDQEQAPGAHGS